MASRKPKEQSKKASDLPKRRSLFDHVNHIRKVQDPDYYVNLSEDDRKSFNHFMLIRAFSMDESMVEDMAQLYQIFDKVPPPQFYQLLIALVPKSNRFYPWIKSKMLKHDKKLLDYVAKRFKVSKYQANDYVNLLLRTEEGQGELVLILKSFGLEDKEVEEMFEEKKDE
jgi:hypothetical protein